MSLQREMLHGCGLVGPTWGSVDRLECKRKDRFECRAKTQATVFQSGTREGIKLTWNIWKSHETACVVSIRFVRRGFSLVEENSSACLYLTLFVSGKIAIAGPNAFSSFWFLKETLATRIFRLFVFSCEGKVLLTPFGDHIFANGDWKKKQRSVASWRLPKKVNFGPCILLKIVRY